MFKGSYVALITPMNLDGSIDVEGLDKLVDFHINNGTDGIVAVGTTGESATVTLTEHVRIVEQVVKFSNGRVPVIAGNGANATAHAIELTQALNGTGVDGMLGVTPYYNKPSPKGLIAHYKAVASHTDIPQILYNVPGRTGVDMQPETIAELSTFKNIVAIKEATGDLSRLHKLKDLCDDSFGLLSGDDATACEFILSGGDGAISVVNNIAPSLYKKMCDSALNGDKEHAYAFDNELSLLHSSLFVEANPIPVKWAAFELGLIKNNTIRLPLTELSSANYGLVKEAMEKAQLEVK
ncbi:4-hydroxy-tetrahydrodipicolinate synthase [Shewanella sp. OPT22]|nr:4-hydroxy-tetrahydrodipicolinate synthase [Shewanella sp. OPT22]